METTELTEQQLKTDLEAKFGDTAPSWDILTDYLVSWLIGRVNDGVVLSFDTVIRVAQKWFDSKGGVRS